MLDAESIFSFKCAIEQVYLRSDAPDPLEKDILIEAYLQDELRVKPELLCNTHFILMLDISGSMDDILEENKTKLEAVVQAACHVIDQLQDHDLISVITFTTEEKLFCWAEPVNNKEKLRNKITEIYEYPRGSTNLFPALKLAKQKLQRMKNSAQNVATKLLILTDGMIHDVESCEPEARHFHEQGIDIDTLGIGADFRGEEMELLTSGFMEKLENAAQTMAVFERSLRILQNTVATKVKVELETTHGVEIRGIAKISPDIKMVNYQSNTISFENVDRNRRYAAVVRTLIDPGLIGEKAIMTATLGFDIPKQNIFDEVIERIVVVNFTSDQARLSEPPNSEVIHASTYYTIAIRAQEIQDNSENKDLIMRNLKLIINRLKKIGDMETMARWEAVRDSYISKGQFSLEEYNSVAVSKSKTSAAYSALPPPDILDEHYDDELAW